MDVPAKRRRDLQADMIGAAIYTPEPEPPYQALAENLITITFEIDPVAIEPYVPLPLRIAPTNTAMFIAYRSSSAWGLGPHERVFFSVEVEGHDSPDTGNGLFLVQTIMDSHAADILEPRFGGGTIPGRLDLRRDGDLVTAHAEASGVPWLDVAVRVKGDVLPNNAGVDRYIGLTSQGIVRHDIAYTATVIDADVVRFDIHAAASPQFAAFQPRGLFVSAVNPVIAGTWSAPHMLTVDEDNESLSAHLELMDREGRPAVIFRGDGTTLRANSAAKVLLGQTTSAHLRDAVRAAAADSARVAKPVLLPCEGGRRPLLAHLMLVRLPGTIEDAVLALLVDTDVAQHREAVPLLRVLGLTNAEALLAELIGSGMSVRDAATASGISEHTARSTLKLVYAKLGISKSSQLGNLVARLRFV